MADNLTLPAKGSKVATNEITWNAETAHAQVVQAFDEMKPADADYVGLGYTGDNLTSVVYKRGGAAGTVLATLTLGYTGEQLTSITKS